MIAIPVPASASASVPSVMFPTRLAVAMGPISITCRLSVVALWFGIGVCSRTNRSFVLNLDIVCARRIALFWGKAKRSRHGVFFGFFDSAELFFALACDTLFVCLVGIGGCCFRTCVPVKIPSLLPSANWCFQAVSEIVLSSSGCRDILPFEIDATARAGFADGLQ